jgi:DNA-damage-inducible protein D
MMKMQNKIIVFESKSIRRIWHNEEWYFSVVDVVGVLTDSIDAKDYWYKMKIRVQLEDELELSTICRQLKLQASDGKKYKTDCANTQGLFRIIQRLD